MPSPLQLKYPPWTPYNIAEFPMKLACENPCMSVVIFCKSHPQIQNNFQTVNLNPTQRTNHRMQMLSFKPHQQQIPCRPAIVYLSVP
mmetsp:Transcript_9120/g.17078  ORF Transcript_9120/g.17078 Transcript_9120/m.17078 type:complete len:87 (+) Transcript_9120:21-281(+)